MCGAVGVWEMRESEILWAGGPDLGSWHLKGGKKRASTRIGRRGEKAVIP